MGTKYTTILTGGVVATYNDDPPSDDDSQTEANRVKYVTITGDLTAPLHSAITSMDANILAQVNEGPTTKSGTYTTASTDHNSTIECTGTITIDLLNPSGNAGYQVAIKNAGVGVVTVEVDGGANVDGAASRTLIAGEGARFRANAAGIAYYSDGMYALDEDNLASDSASYLATQQSIKAYVDAVDPSTTIGIVFDTDDIIFINTADDAAPTGWTKLTTTAYENAALRVTATPGSPATGNNNFTTNFANRTTGAAPSASSGPGVGSEHSTAGHTHTLNMAVNYSDVMAIQKD